MTALDPAAKRMVTPIARMVRGEANPKRQTAMHMLITINDLKPLTDTELARLEAQLRHILETHALTTDDRITIIASLVNIRSEIECRVGLKNRPLWFQI